MHFPARLQNVKGKVEVSIAIATPSDQREIDCIAADGATIRDIVEDGVKKGVVPRELRGAAVGVGGRKALTVWCEQEIE